MDTIDIRRPDLLLLTEIFQKYCIVPGGSLIFGMVFVSCAVDLLGGALHRSGGRCPVPPVPAPRGGH